MGPISSYVQTNATTPNIVGPTMLGLVVSVLAVHRGKKQPISLCKPCVMRVRGPNNFGRAVQTDPTLLRYASAIKKQQKCWELLAQTLTSFNFKTQHVISNNVAFVCTELNSTFT